MQRCFDRQGLQQRHIQMIALAGAIGTVSRQSRELNDEHGQLTPIPGSFSWVWEGGSYWWATGRVVR